LLAERAVAGDESARAQLVDDVYRPLTRAGAEIVPTLRAYLESAGSLEGTARLLFVHPNTVRYRLQRAFEVSGYDAARPPDRYPLWLALTLGRLSEDGESL
jgi:DNA-binding PucR family transcriptional regulator